MAGVKVKNGQKVAARLIELGRRFERVASGEVQQKVNAAIAPQIDAIGKAKIRRHTESGFSAEQWLVANGRSLRVRKVTYLGYHRWWPFRGKRLPLAVLKKMALAYRNGFAAELSGRGLSSSDADIAAALTGGE